MKNVTASPRNKDPPVFASAIVGYGQSAKQIARRRQLNTKWKFMVRSARLLKVRRICSVVKLLSIKKMEIEENTLAAYFYKWKDAFNESRQTHQYSSTCNLSTEVSMDSTVIQTPLQYKVAISTMNTTISTSVVWKSMAVRLRNRQRFRYFQAIARKYYIYQRKRECRNRWLKLVKIKVSVYNKKAYYSIKNWDRLVSCVLIKDEKQRSKWNKFTSGLLFRRKTELFRKEAAKLKWIYITGAISNKCRVQEIRQMAYTDKWQNLIYSYVDILEFYNIRNDITNEIRPHGSSWLSIANSSYINKLLFSYIYVKGSRNIHAKHRLTIIELKYDWCRISSKILSRNNIREATVLKGIITKRINDLKLQWKKFTSKLFLQEIQNQYDFVITLEESKLKVHEISESSLLSRFFVRWTNFYRRRVEIAEEHRREDEKRNEAERKREEERRKQEEAREKEFQKFQEENERERKKQKEREKELLRLQVEREKEFQKIQEEREKERAMIEAKREALRKAELERERQKIRELEEERERERARIAELEAANAKLMKMKAKSRSKKIIAPGARPSPGGIPLVALKDSREVFQVRERTPLRTTSPVRRIRPVASAEEINAGSPAGSLWLVEERPPSKVLNRKRPNRVTLAARPIYENTSDESEEYEEEYFTEVSIEYGEDLNALNSQMFDASVMQSSYIGFDGYAESDAEDLVNEIVTINVMSNLDYLRDRL